jgi:hypothetical protein
MVSADFKHGKLIGTIRNDAYFIVCFCNKKREQHEQYAKVFHGWVTNFQKMNVDRHSF